MRWLSSISARLTVFVSAAVLAGGLLTWPFWVWIDHLIEPSSAPDPNVLGLAQASYIVKRSLRRNQDGTARVEITPELMAYRSRNPNFRLAVFATDTGPALEGSDPDLVDAIELDDQRHVVRTSVRIPGDAEARRQFWLASAKTQIGTFPIALYGFQLHAEDFLYIIYSDAEGFGILSFAPSVLFAVAASWMIVRKGLSPLNHAVKDLDHVELNTLDHRFLTEEFPPEMAPFFGAMNDALSRLEAGVAAQRRFVANAAHELRTPIALLCAHIEEADDTAFKPYVKRDALRIKLLVEQMLVSAAISAQQIVTEEPIDLYRTVLDVILDYMPVAVDNGRHIELDGHSTLVKVKGNQRAVGSIVANLIDNALRAEPQNGTIVVRVSDDGQVEVVDHGEGVNLEDRDRVFEPFWRKDASSADGIGLGLSIVKDTTELLDGWVWVEETPGGGATFKVRFRVCP